MKELLDTYKVAIDLLQWLLMGVMAIIGWQIKRDKSQDTQLSSFGRAFTDKLAEHEARIKTVEEKMNHVPRDTEVVKLTAQIESLEKSIEKLSLMVDRQQQFLMSNR